MVPSSPDSFGKSRQRKFGCNSFYYKVRQEDFTCFLLAFLKKVMTKWKETEKDPQI